MADQSAPAAPMRCGQCDRPLTWPGLCRDCRRVYPLPRSVDHFALLGLPRRYDIDLERLQRRFVELARLVHPDYFADCGPEGRLAAMHNSARINQAYQTLRDPLGRAEYLLELSGGKSSSEDRSVPGDLLGQMMMLREQIEQAKADGDQQALSRLKEQILRRQAGLQQRIARLARRLGQQPADQELLDELRRQLNAVRYVNNLLSAL